MIAAFYIHGMQSLTRALALNEATYAGDTAGTQQQIKSLLRALHVEMPGTTLEALLVGFKPPST